MFIIGGFIITNYSATADGNMIPPSESDFLLSDGTDFLLSDGTNFLLSS